jgi:hypothetical protein
MAAQIFHSFCSSKDRLLLKQHTRYGQTTCFTIHIMVMPFPRLARTRDGMAFSTRSITWDVTAWSIDSLARHHARIAPLHGIRECKAVLHCGLWALQALLLRGIAAPIA